MGVSVKKTISLSAWFSSLLVLLLSLIAPVSVFAFSANGSGTETIPFRISTCSQLQEIDNDLSGYYVLVANIDCEGVTFAHLAGSADFTGTLDGKNHVVKNINFDNYGLFQSTDGATIKNIFLDSGSVSGDYYVGSVVGHANNSIISNVHSSIDVEAVSYSGGLVGSSTGNTSVTKSSYSGNLTGQAYSGGLVGAMWDSGTSITDSFVDGTVHAYSPYVGALVGGFFNGVINRVYSSATIDTGANYYVGGLVGDDQGVVSNSFSATTLSAATSYYGGLVGLDVSGTYDNDFIDGYLSGSINWCSGSGELPGCTMVNSGNNESNYFKNNSINAPFETWDFNEIWQTTPGYPTLRDIALFDSPVYPNNGDANSDGIQDSYQGNVANIVDRNGIWSTVSVPASSGCTIDNASSNENDSSHVDTGFTAKTSLDAFSIFCSSSSESVSVSIIYDKVYSGSVLRFYNPVTHSYSSVPGVVYSTITVGGVTKTIATYNITDGSALDIDGISNGIIVDPVQLAVAITPPNTGIGIDGLVNRNSVEFIALAFSLFSLTYVLSKAVKD